MLSQLPFRAVWAVDFEFSAPPGERPHRPVCMVAKELKSGQVIRLWGDQFGPCPPFPLGPDTLYVAYFSSAEFGCHLALGWPLPDRVLDLYVEHRWFTNGRKNGFGNGLLGALAYRGLDGIGAEEKEHFRDLAIRGGPYTDEERLGLIDYCAGDVDALERLLPAMLPDIDLPRA